MGFTSIDYIILVAYLIGVTLVGVMFRRSQTTAKDYFLGKKNTHWFVICASIVATETSTLTLIGVPAIAFGKYAFPEQGGNFTYLQVVLGYIIARFLIAFVFVPAYFKGEIDTAYRLLENRFGTKAKNLAASMFLIVRALGDGVRTFAASIVISAVLAVSLPDLPYLPAISILIVGGLTLIYTFEGGLTAVLWTDLIQLFIYLTGSIIAAVVLINAIPGGFSEVVATGTAAGKFDLLSFRFDLNVPFTFWAGLIGGTFLTTASHGTDQMLVQRLIACKSESDSRKAIITSGFIVFFQFALLLFVGVMLFAFYEHFPPATDFKTNDEVFPKFIVENMPVGIAGLMIAALTAAAMSTLSSSLNSLASSTVFDLYRPLIAPNASDESLLKVSRWLTAAWGIVLIGIAFIAQDWGSVFTVGLTIASLIYGPMLGAFLLGVFSKRANQTGVIVGMIVSQASMIAIKILTGIAWTWFVVIGASICVIVGIAVSLVTRHSDGGEK